MLAALLLPCAAGAQTVGEPLPPWSPGILDIHQIGTGRGNAALLVFPDGTSLLVDAGDGNPDPPAGANRVPDGSRSAGEWIARYARRMLSHQADPAIDYGLLTHFHGDHMGGVGPATPTEPGGEYRLTGITDVVSHMPIRTMLDRGWPDYTYPRPLDNAMMDNYRAFLEVEGARRGMTVERLEPGRADQIVLRHDPDRYPNFTVRNVAANGEVWTGAGDGTHNHFPALADIPREDWPTENECSLAIRVSYGAFDFYTGGDMPGQPAPGLPSWQNVERPVAEAVGAVDVAVANHHGIGDTTIPFFVRSLRPRVWIVPSRMAGHPDRFVFARMSSTRLYDGPRDIFSVTTQDATRQVVVQLRELDSEQGHIVVRVESGGARYRVIILDDSDENDTIKAIHGPYAAR
jgi:beta-lactamase superfamily II metal-dependent hydrolase